jgi:hypothetical protein
MNRMPDLTRPHLIALRNGLLRWHKSLLDAERAAYERDVARITSTGQYLQFAWLREISQFIVIVDETLAQKEPATPLDAARLIAKARELLVPSGSGSEFARRYEEAMQRDPAAVLAHGEMMLVFAELAKD